MISVNATVVSGSGRGKDLGIPTLNLSLKEIPQNLEEGIYAGWAEWDGAKHMAAIHYGARPVFQDTASFEVHIIDEQVADAPEEVLVTLVQHLRGVEDFPSTEDLLAQVRMDIDEARVILQSL